MWYNKRKLLFYPVTDKKQLLYIVTGKSAGGGRDPPNSREETPRQAEGQLKVPAQPSPGRD